MSSGPPPSRPSQAVLLAGGRGSRLAPITDSTHKGMVRFAGKPFMGHIVDRLRDQGITDVLFLLGYRADDIQEHFGDGSAYGVDIAYDVLSAEDLTAKRVLHAWDLIDDTFLLLYCDNDWPVDLERLWKHHQASGLPCQITVYSNEDGWTRDSVIVEDGVCTVFDRTRTTPDLAGVEISYAILQKEAIAPHLPPDGDELFEQAVYPPLARAGQLAAYWTRHRYVSVGGHRRLPITRDVYERGPAIALDRDGTLIEKAPEGAYVTSAEDVQWLPGAREALRLLREAGYRIYLVTNQAGVALGAVTEEQVEAINVHLRDTAIAAGGWIDGWEVCPHHWDDGCDRRKPAPGMFFELHRRHHLDLSRTWYLGDDVRDGYAAWNAEMPFALVDEQRTLLDRVRALLAGTLEPEVFPPPPRFHHNPTPVAPDEVVDPYAREPVS